MSQEEPNNIFPKKKIDPALWQTHWHDILDHAVGPDKNREAGIKEADMMSDFRLQFEMWNASESVLREAFEIFPRGDEMVERALHIVGRKPTKKPSEQDAVEALRNAIAAASKFVDLPIEADAAGYIMRGPWRERNEYMARRDGIFSELSDRLFDLVEAGSGDLGVSAADFLSEPTYRLGGNDYLVSEWILWPLVHDPEGLDPYQYLLDFGFYVHQTYEDSRFVLYFADD